MGGIFGTVSRSDCVRDLFYGIDYHFNLGNHCDGQMLNFSPSGMCIRTDRFFKPGAAVVIRIDQFPRGEAARKEQGGMRAVTLARVQWSRGDKDKSGKHYTSGVRYL